MVPVGVTVELVNCPVMPAGSPETLTFTGAANPPEEVSVTE